jgi:hypothetical protein
MLSSLIPKPSQQLPILDLLKAVSARRSQMRQLASDILVEYASYKKELQAVELDNDALLNYANLDAVNKHGEEIAQHCKSLQKLRSDLRGYSRRLGEALPRATEDLIRRGNAILFDNPVSAGTNYLLAYAEADSSEYVVELLATGESPTQDLLRIQSTQQLMDKPELASCIEFFSE